KAGVFATWGQQTNVIGTVGFGLVFDPKAFGGMVEKPTERRIKLRAKPGEELSYVVQGDWLRGRTYPRCPTIDNWREELKRLARQYQSPLTVDAVPPKTTKQP